MTDLTVGFRLRVLREGAGFTIDDVAGRTRVPARAILALEEDRWRDLPAPVYVRGFIRAIAGLCGAPDGEIQELLSGYRREAPPTHINVPSIKKSDLLVPIFTSSEAEDRARAAFGLALVVLGIIAIPIVAFLIS